MKDLRNWAVARPEAVEPRVANLDVIIGDVAVCVSIGDDVSVVVSADGEPDLKLRHAMMLYTIKGIKLVTPTSTRMSKKKLSVRNCLNLVAAVDAVIKG